MMNVIINDTIKAQCERLQIEGMKSPKFSITETSQGTCSEATLGDAGTLKIRAYAKDEDLFQLFYTDAVTIKTESGLILKGTLVGIESQETLPNVADLEIQLLYSEQKLAQLGK